MDYNKAKTHYFLKLTVLVAADVVSIAVAYLLALWLRFDKIESIPTEYIIGTLYLLLLLILTTVLFNYSIIPFHKNVKNENSTVYFA
ncbi:MAG: hypothetical protein LIV24_03000 [Eubacterium sp.]|nr:hypothetical protein [Eubacterium sp.]